MKNYIENDLYELVERYPVLVNCKEQIKYAYEILEKTYRSGKKVLIAGNGGSAADSEHIVGELMKGFLKKRKLSDVMASKLIAIDEKMGKELAEKLQGALPTISLVGHPALSTAYLNDIDPLLGMAQQIMGYGMEGDTFFGITTSGNSQNILYAMIVAKAKGLKTIALTGKNGGKVKNIADISIIVDNYETYQIQELHLPIYHCLCKMLEETFWGE